MSPLKVCKPVVGDSHHFYEEPDQDHDTYLFITTIGSGFCYTERPPSIRGQDILTDMYVNSVADPDPSNPELFGQVGFGSG
jgi:hypothetical protein